MTKKQINTILKLAFNYHKIGQLKIIAAIQGNKAKYKRLRELELKAVTALCNYVSNLHYWCNMFK